MGWTRKFVALSRLVAFAVLNELCDHSAQWMNCNNSIFDLAARETNGLTRQRGKSRGGRLWQIAPG